MPGDDRYPGGGPYTIGGVHAHNPLCGIAGRAKAGGNRYDTGPGSLMKPPQLWQ
jgi:hypothetical protein